VKGCRFGAWWLGLVLGGGVLVEETRPKEACASAIVSASALRAAEPAAGYTPGHCLKWGIFTENVRKSGE
jgi:hypothetical protein